MIGTKGVVGDISWHDNAVYHETILQILFGNVLRELATFPIFWQWVRQRAHCLCGRQKGDTIESCEIEKLANISYESKTMKMCGCLLIFYTSQVKTDFEIKNKITSGLLGNLLLWSVDIEAVHYCS